MNYVATMVSDAPSEAKAALCGTLLRVTRYQDQDRVLGGPEKATTTVILELVSRTHSSRNPEG